MPANPESILDSTKQVLGVDADYTAFDLDVVMAVNSAFGPLTQAGVGPSTGFSISDNTTLWSSYVTDLTYLGMVKQFIWMSAKMAFDPPATSFALAAIQKQLDELIWRINSAVELAVIPSSPGARGAWWDLTGLDQFPDNAEFGDLGWDSVTGDVWANRSNVYGYYFW